jgi:hypothetical protein
VEALGVTSARVAAGKAKEGVDARRGDRDCGFRLGTTCRHDPNTSRQGVRKRVLDEECVRTLCDYSVDADIAAIRGKVMPLSWC